MGCNLLCLAAVPSCTPFVVFDVGISYTFNSFNHKSNIWYLSLPRRITNKEISIDHIPINLLR